MRKVTETERKMEEKKTRERPRTLLDHLMDQNGNRR